MAKLFSMLCGFLLLVPGLCRGEAPTTPAQALPPSQEAAPSAAVQGGTTPAAPAPELVADGRALFTGKRPFAKGGAPCVSCHTLRYPGVYGGALAGDLTRIHAMMGESGVRAVLGSLTFPVMRRVYAERPLTGQEQEALVALFADSSARNSRAWNPYPAAGVGCFAAFIAIAALFKRRIG